MARDTALCCSVVDGEIHIRIGVDVLAFAAQYLKPFATYDPVLNEFRKDWVVTDAQQFAQDVADELAHEEEDGSSPLSVLLDECCVAALEQGSLGLSEVIADEEPS